MSADKAVERVFFASSHCVLRRLRARELPVISIPDFCLKSAMQYSKILSSKS